MTEPLDLEAIRKLHAPTMLYGDGKLPVCSVERTAIPCDTWRLCDEVERLRGEFGKAMQMARIEIALRRWIGQSEAPTVSDGGKG